MNKLDSSSPILIYSETTASHLNHMPACRLIVLIPTASDYTSATRRISDLAKASGAHVLFLGLCSDVTQELSLRRELVTLSALLAAARVPAEAKVEIGTNWVNIIKRNYQAGDALLCFAEQHAGFMHRPLSQILESNLKAPVYVLSNVSPRILPQSDWLSQIMAWSGSVGIIIGFFLLQIRINSYPQDWAQTVLMILSVVGEIWLIWIWNRLFS